MHVVLWSTFFLIVIAGVSFLHRWNRRTPLPPLPKIVRVEETGGKGALEAILTLDDGRRFRGFYNTWYEYPGGARLGDRELSDHISAERRRLLWEAERRQES